MEPYLYHGIRDYNVDRLINILETGFILPKKMLPDRFSVNRENQLDLNGQSWISLSQKSLYDDYYESVSTSAFDFHVRNHICIVIHPGIEGINYTNFLLYDYYGPQYVRGMVNDDSEDRYSTYMDEVQTRIPIPTSKFIAIGYPKVFLIKRDRKRNIENELQRIKGKLDEKGLVIPIVDSSYEDFADDMECIKRMTLM